MLNKVKVNEVKEAPAIGKPEMMSGIHTKDAAERWAIKNGYTVVYLFKKHERVYAMVASAQGQVLLEVAFWVALVLFVVLVLLKDVPW